MSQIEVPLEFERRALEAAMNKSRMKERARLELAGLWAPALIDEQRRLYVDDHFDVDEFERRVDEILHGRLPYVT